MRDHRTPDHARRAFARTNPQTIAQRARILAELAPGARSIVELCAGDCREQAAAYARIPGLESFRALDVDPAIVEANRAHGIDCRLGDALDRSALAGFLEADAIVFGPPLSEDCDGHRLLDFDHVRPGYLPFAELLLGELAYAGLLICVGPRTTTLGDAARLSKAIHRVRPERGLSLVHHSISTVTGAGIQTPPRRKYVELWFSPTVGDAWTLRESEGWP